MDFRWRYFLIVLWYLDIPKRNATVFIGIHLSIDGRVPLEEERSMRRRKNEYANPSTSYGYIWFLIMGNFFRLTQLPFDIFLIYLLSFLFRAITNRIFPNHLFSQHWRTKNLWCSVGCTVFAHGLIQELNSIHKQNRGCVQLWWPSRPPDHLLGYWTSILISYLRSTSFCGHMLSNQIDFPSSA